MKTKENKKSKSVIKQLRDIRETISADIKDLSFEELKKYLNSRTKVHSKSSWQK
jgi:hypothetical protein